MAVVIAASLRTCSADRRMPAVHPANASASASAGMRMNRRVMGSSAVRPEEECRKTHARALGGAGGCKVRPRRSSRLPGRGLRNHRPSLVCVALWPARPAPETKRLPATQNRSGRSTAFVIPIRGPVETRNSRGWSGGSMVSAPAVRSTPLSRSVMPSARVRFPGPEASRVAPGFGPPPAGHGRGSLLRLERPDQHAAPGAGGPGGRVEAHMDAVSHEDVGVAAFAVEQGVAARPERRVGGAVLRTQVRLGLDDAASRLGAAASRHQHAAEQIARDDGGPAQVERARQRHRSRRSAGAEALGDEPPQRRLVERHGGAVGRRRFGLEPGLAEDDADVLRGIERALGNQARQHRERRDAGRSGPDALGAGQRGGRGSRSSAEAVADKVQHLLDPVAQGVLGQRATSRVRRRWPAPRRGGPDGSRACA